MSAWSRSFAFCSSIEAAGRGSATAGAAAAARRPLAADVIAATECERALGVAAADGAGEAPLGGRAAGTLNGSVTRTPPRRDGSGVIFPGRCGGTPGIPLSPVAAGMGGAAGMRASGGIRRIVPSRGLSPSTTPALSGVAFATAETGIAGAAPDGMALGTGMALGADIAFGGAAIALGADIPFGADTAIALGAALAAAGPADIAGPGVPAFVVVIALVAGDTTLRATAIRSLDCSTFHQARPPRTATRTIFHIEPPFGAARFACGRAAIDSTFAMRGG